MGRPQLALALTCLLASLTSGHHIPGHQLSLFPPSKHFPPEDAPIFQRADVESEPRNDEVEYGSWSLPLRSAVESVPERYAAHRSPSRDAVENSLKSPERSAPLREAVEHRVPPSFGGFDYDSFWLERISPPAIRKQTYPPNVVCHIDTESVYREEPFMLLPRSVPAHKCTHLVYTAATLHPQEFTIIPRDTEYDVIRGGYIAAVGLRRRDPALRVLISIASPDHGRLFREILTEPEERLPVFVDSLLDFIEEHDFDGAEIDWDSATASSLKKILSHLRNAFVERGYTLLVAIRPEQLADAELAELADLLVLRAWHPRRVAEVVQSPAPLNFVTNFVETLKKRGVPPSKIIVGFPLFGWSYKLAHRDDGESTLANGFGIDGPYTKHRGQLAYFEICEKLEDPWQYKRHEINGSYIILGDQWIGYDDPLSVKIKAAYVKSSNLGGISLFSLDLDDFQGICGDEWPMFNAATRTLGIYDGPDEKCPKTGLYSDPDNCSGFLSCYNGRLHRGQCGIGRFYDHQSGRCLPASPEMCDPGHSDQFSYVNQHLERLRQRQRLEKLDLADESETPRVVCYVTSWAMYRKGEGKFVPEHLDARLCTDVVYAFAGLNPEMLTVHSFDPWADIEHNLYQRVTSITGPRVLLALGGWTDSAGDKYSRLVSSPASRRKFVASAVHFLRKHNFQGLSIEWNYPGCWQSDCRRGPETDKSNFARLLAELRREFDQQEPKLTLAVALSGYKEVIDKGYNVPEISRHVDFMTVMSYDYHGAWEAHTSHLAPLFAIPGDSSPYYNLNFTLNYLASLGADRSKIIADIPIYGQSYKLTSPSNYALGDAAAGPGTAGEYTRQPGMLAYHEICERIEKEGWKEELGPSAHHKDQFVSFDNAKSIAYKGQFILNNGFGGAAAWTVDLDDFTNRCCQEPFPLLRSINRALGRLLTPAPSHKDCKKPDEPITPLPPTMTPHPDGSDGQPLPSRPQTSTTQSTTWPSWTPPSSWDSTTTTTTKRPSWQQTTMTWWPTSSTTTTTTTRRPTYTTKPSTKPPRPTVAAPTSSPTGSLDGRPCEPGDHKPDLSNCGTYYRCVLGEFRREFCTPGLHWDSTRRVCDWPIAAKCQKKPVNNQPPSTTTRRPTYTPSTPAATTNKPSSKPDGRDCEHGQYYPYPDSCTAFLICVNGQLVRQQCGPGLNWNKAKNMCDWAFKAPCDENKKKKPTMSMKMNLKDEELSCNSGEYQAVPGKCEAYYACLWGKYEEFQCAPGLHFNAESHICDWPVRAKCMDNSNNNNGGSVSGGQVGEIPFDPINPDVTTSKPWKPPSQATTPLPSAEIDPNAVSPLSGHFKIVCYFTNWAWYRRGIGRYLPEHIDHTLCTHIVYGFAVLDYSNLVLKAHDSWADYDNHFYERVVAYKKRGVKVSLALGGWNDSQGDKYSRLVNNPAARRRFIEHALQFIEKYGFDGLDLDWEYPVCWQTDCSKGPASDKEGFTAWVRELSEAFRPRGLLLSTATSPSKKIIDAGYDVPEISKYFDWISVMTYDYHGQWDKRTGHVAPMYYHDDDEFFYFNANYTINYWISKGAPPRTIVMGMPLYGQAFTINDPSRGTGLNSPASSAGQAGEFTKAAGFLAYYEICDRINNKGWTVVQDPQRRMGPYAYKGNQWVGFDDADMIRQKAQYVRDMGLGGGMVWALDLDDFRGRCGEGPHPLMRSLQQVLAEPPNQHDRPISPPIIGQELTWQPSKPPSKLEQINSDVPVETDDEYKVVCYFTNWAWYRQGQGKFLPEDIDADLCSHIVYGFAVLNGDQGTIATHDSWADIDNKFYERVVAYKAKGKKVLIAIGGWNDSAGDKYSKLVNNPSKRKRFIANVIQFIEKWGFDGLDLDWEYPVCWQVDCNKGPKSDKEGFTAWVKELSEEFRPRGWLLSSAVSPNKRVISEGYDVAELSNYFDWIAVMAYDYHGQWDKKTGHNAPFYARPDDWDKTFNANYSMHFWLEKGAPPKKLIMGMPLYGQSFSLAERGDHGLNAPTYGGGEAGNDTRARGFLSYYEICQRTLTRGWTVVQDPQRRIGPYAYQGDQWVSFDDAEQLRRKSEYIKELGLGGGMVWALDLDDFKNVCGCEPYPLLRTINRVLRNYPAGPSCKVSSSVVTESEPKPWEPTTGKPSTGWEWVPPSTTTTWSWTTSSTTPNIPVEVATEDVDAVEIEAGGKPPSQSPSEGSCHGKLFIAHKSDCRKYYLCNFGQLTEQTCPNGLHWYNDHCDWPENSKCKARYNGISMINSQRLKEDTSFDGRKLICYFTSWSAARQGSGKFMPEDINSNLCTHVIYSFASLDPETLTIRSRDRTTDIGDDFYGRVTALKKKGVKVLLGLGGWRDSSGDKYSRLVNDPAARTKFVAETTRFVEKYGFSGLDIDWNYPVCWQGDCKKGRASDKKSYAALIRQLSTEFRPRQLLLSASVSPNKQIIDNSYDVPTLAKYLDWLGVMSYDYHQQWEKKTGPVAPLYFHAGDEFDQYNVNFTMNYWISKGAPAKKLVMGVPFYGQSFTLESAEKNGWQAPTKKAGKPAEYTRASGFMSYYEICKNAKKNKWLVKKDPDGRIGAYATHDDQWVAYEDVSDVARKANYVRDLDLGGGMVWALDLDDFNNICGCGKYPLLTAFAKGLRAERPSRDCT